MDNKLKDTEVTIQELYRDKLELQKQLEGINHHVFYLQTLLGEAAIEITRYKNLIQERNDDIDFLIGDNNDLRNSLNDVRFERILEWYINEGLVEDFTSE